MTNATLQDHWHILGAGAIGSLWACYAFRDGRPATLILRDAASLEAYHQYGGMMARLGASAEQLPLPATSPESLAAPVARVLITTKAQQTLAALEGIAATLAEAPLLVLLQNGLGVAEQIVKRHPQATVLQASTTEGAYREGPFGLVHAGRGQTLLGQSQTLYPEHRGPRIDHTALAQIARALSPPPLNAQVSDDIDRALWRKLAVNSAINPLTVKYRCRNGELLDNPNALAEMAKLVEETVNLSRRLGRGDWVEDLLPQVRQIAGATAMNRSSMLQDVEAGRETEIEYITGYLCHLGEQWDTELPTHQHLLQTVRKLRG